MLATWSSPGQLSLSSSASSFARWVVRAALEARGTLQVDFALLCLGQQPPAHAHHRAVLEGRDARPLESGGLLKSALRISAAVGLPLLHPLVGHNLCYHRLRKLAVHLRVGQQQRDLLVAHDRAGHLLDAVDILKVDRHRKDEDAPRVLDLLGAGARGEVFDIEEDMDARADLAVALLDELAHVLAQSPSMREKEMEAGGVRWGILLPVRPCRMQVPAYAARLGHRATDRSGKIAGIEVAERVDWAGPCPV
eukprot:3150633-Prymnesium_polylepis.1